MAQAKKGEAKHRVSKQGREVAQAKECMVFLQNRHQAKDAKIAHKKGNVGYTPDHSLAFQKAIVFAKKALFHVKHPMPPYKSPSAMENKEVHIL